MKRSALAAAIVIFSAAAAFAGVQDFGKFSVDVPEGWTAAKDGTATVITNSGNNASIRVSVESTKGENIKAIVSRLADSSKAANIKQDGNNFSFTSDVGKEDEKLYFVKAGDDSYTFVVITGLDNAPDELSAIMDSITEK